MRWTTGVVCTLVLMACGGKRERDQPAVDAPPAGPLAQVVGDARTLPPTARIEEYVGAAACGECHGDIYAQWKRSPHGRAMAPASAETVLGGFDGVAVAHQGGDVVPLRDGERFVMDIRTAAGTERLPVDLVLAAGRQQQVYFTRDADGTFVLLPIFWATTDESWVSTALYQGASLEPGHRGFWRNSTLERMDCWACHLSQRHRVLGQAARFDFVDHSINCEACHGPGRDHVAARKRSDASAGTYPDLKALAKEQEGRLCATCHGAQQFFQLPPADDGWPQPFIQTLANPGLRVDGTQRITTYQYSGHLLSRCYLDGAMVCSSCHDPHHQDARSHIGESAEGADSDKQCTVCHRDQLDLAVARKHSRHSAKVYCVDCHMAFSWIGDDPRRHQKTSDHSISIPRPAESIAVGTPNACTTCHTDHDDAWAAAAVDRWGWKAAGQARPWVVTIADGRARKPGAGRALLAVAVAATTDDYLRASALELLGAQPADPSLVAELAPLAEHANAHVRQTAIAALMTHDQTNAMRWRRAGSADRHPFVRMKTFDLEADARSFDAATITRQIEDATRYYARPVAPLIAVTKVLADRGELADASRLADEVLAMATPDERKHLGVQRNAEHLRRRLRLEGGGK